MPKELPKLDTKHRAPSMLSRGKAQPASEVTAERQLAEQSREARELRLHLKAAHEARKQEAAPEAMETEEEAILREAGVKGKGKGKAKEARARTIDRHRPPRGGPVTFPTACG